MIKKVQVVIGLIILCLIGYLIYGMYGEQINQLVEEIRGSIEAVTEEITEEVPEKLSEEDTDLTQMESESETEVVTEPVTEEKIVLPDHYDDRESGRAPVIKNQGELGTCWAVTASSALESALLPEEHFIFSADHISLKNTYGKSQEEGGAYIMSMSYFAGWMGPVLENEDPYGDGISPDGLEPTKHVQEMQIIREKDIEKAKEMVYRYGAIQSSFYMDMDSTAHSSVFYNEFEHAYCYNGEKEANHDVIVIGWDDNYPKENFSVDVKKDGAFICQNSWGEQFGDGGVFYVSYEDVLIGSYCVSYTRIEDTDNYDHLYQTDLCGWIGQVGYESEECYFANVYESDQDENLAAVGFYATDSDTEYTVYIAEEFKNSLSLVGQKAVAQGKFENPGYYTVELDQPIDLKQGQKFAVIVKISTPGAQYPVATEYKADENSQNVIITDGEGYISQNGINWKNTEENYSCNLCLKAYTKKGN